MHMTFSRLKVLWTVCPKVPLHRVHCLSEHCTPQAHNITNMMLWQRKHSGLLEIPVHYRLRNKRKNDKTVHRPSINIAHSGAGTHGLHTPPSNIVAGH